MNLINKLTQKIKYTQPAIEITELNGEDIITSSGVKSGFQISNKTKKEVEEIKEQSRKLTFYEKYPDGLPLMVLEYLDYGKFGAMLKQEQLLPPSYDRRPAEVSVTFIGDVPRLKLTFKSKTTNSIILLSIYKYHLSCAKKMDKSYHGNMEMEKIWREFAKRTMYLWENGYRYKLLDHNRKAEVKTSLQEDIDYIESVRKAEENQTKI